MKVFAVAFTWENGELSLNIVAARDQGEALMLAWKIQLNENEVTRQDFNRVKVVEIEDAKPGCGQIFSGHSDYETCGTILLCPICESGLNEESANERPRTD